MMEKVTLTQEQASAIEGLLRTVSKDGVLNHHSKISDNNGKSWLLIKELSTAVVAKALYIGYEVEEEHKVGDWKKVVLLNGKWAIGQIDTLAFDDIIFNYLDENTVWQRVRQPAKASTDPTPEEIKAEKERVVWKSIGRSYREIKEGDKYKVDCFDRTIDDDEHSKKVLRDCLNNGESITFYPVESAISFGGESHDS